MGQIHPSYNQGNERFHQLLNAYEIHDLRNIYEYLTSDFLRILRSMETKKFLKELAPWRVIDVEKYETLRKDLDRFAFAEKMVEDILAQGRKAIIGFWECLFENYDILPCNNLSSLYFELLRSGDTLMQQIHLDKYGYPLSAELKDIQDHHKRHLLEYAQNIGDSSPEVHHGEHYMDMMVLHADHFQKHSQHELIEGGEKHERYLRNNVPNVGQFISVDRLFPWSYGFKCFPHSIMITGARGVGKSTLMQKFVCDWANGKIYQRFSFVFFFRFRELNRWDTASLETMILHVYPYLQGHLTSILQSPEKILFIFEGLDESIHQINFRSHQLCSKTSQVENVGLVVVNLVRQSLLKGCSVLITSKTARITRRDIRPFNTVVEIMGFSPKDKEIYFHNFFKKRTLSDQVISYVKSNGALFNLCYIPTFCSIVCETFSVHFKDQPMTDENLPKTLTQLMAHFVVKILSNHKQDKSHVRRLLSSLGWMADYGLSNNIVHFQESVLTTFHVDASSELLQYFMLKTGNPPNVTFSFLHLLLPDFLAALAHYINCSLEKLNTSLENANSYKDCHDEMFLCFLCGLSDQSTRSILKPYLGNMSSRAITCAVKCVSSWIIQQSTSKVDNMHDTRRCLTMFYYLYETQNKHLVKEALRSCKRLGLKSVLLTRLDCTVLSFILQSCKDIDDLDLNYCVLHRDYLKQFTANLHNFKDVGLIGVHMGDDGIQSVCPALIHPESKIQSLWLSYNNLTNVSCIHLASAINNNQTLKILYLCYNNLPGPHFSDLMEALSSPDCRIEELSLDSVGLTERSCIQLASVIRNNRSLRRLHLSENFFVGPHFSDLMEALGSPDCRIWELELCNIGLDDENAPLLKPLGNSAHLSHLVLSRNCLSDVGACHIKELILKSSSLKDISLFLNSMITREMRESLRNLKTQKPDLYVLIDG